MYSISTKQDIEIFCQRMTCKVFEYFKTSHEYFRLTKVDDQAVSYEQDLSFSVCDVLRRMGDIPIYMNGS